MVYTLAMINCVKLIVSVIYLAYTCTVSHTYGKGGSCHRQLEPLQGGDQQSCSRWIVNMRLLHSVEQLH